MENNPTGMPVVPLSTPIANRCVNLSQIFLLLSELSRQQVLHAHLVTSRRAGLLPQKAAHPPFRPRGGALGNHLCQGANMAGCFRIHPTAHEPWFFRLRSFESYGGSSEATQAS